MKLAYTQNQGSKYLRQQDCIWTGLKSIQLQDQPVEWITIKKDLLIAIADGVSASPCAESASRFVVQALEAAIIKHGFTNKAIRLIHEQLSSKYKKTKCYGASTSLLAAFINDHEIKIMGVGDCRAYLINQQNKLTLLTKDHSYINQLIQEGLAIDGIEYALCYNLLTDCLIADPEEIEFDVFNTAQTLCTGDRILICTDGIYNTLGKDFENYINVNLSVEAQTQKIREAVLQNSPADNFSLMVLGFN